MVTLSGFVMCLRYCFDSQLVTFCYWSESVCEWMCEFCKRLCVLFCTLCGSVRDNDDLYLTVDISRYLGGWVVHCDH